MSLFVLSLVEIGCISASPVASDWTSSIGNSYTAQLCMKLPGMQSSVTELFHILPEIPPELRDMVISFFRLPGQHSIAALCVDLVQFGVRGDLNDMQ